MSAPAATGVVCPLCGWTASEFLPQGRLGRANARCGGCNSLERHRALYLFLRDETSVLKGPTRLLHFAPEAALRKVFEAEAGVDYVTTDLEMNDVSVRMDICDLLFKDETFDCIICSHVLEHVPDDRLAMRELRRVLKREGLALVMVPILRTADGLTYEDPEVATPEERERVFGQEDHVRIYGGDFPDRLRASGFDVEELNPGRDLDPTVVSTSGLYREERIFVCRRGLADRTPRTGRLSPPARGYDDATVAFDTRVAADDQEAEPANLEGYFKAGLDAIRLIDEAIERAGVPDPVKVLDLPCGYGRVSRMLRARFPQAALTACDPDRAAAEFCRDMLGADVATTRDELSPHARFDLIWSSASRANLPESAARSHLASLAGRLDDSGVLVFTAPGESWIRKELNGMPGLTVLAVRRNAWEERQDVYVCQGARG